MSDWLPIDSAPRDGTAFLATWLKSWDHKNSMHIEAVTFDGEAFSYAYDGDQSTKPSHWMPLPKPPVKL
jgi:Protein of unknown function (DUF551)